MRYITVIIPLKIDWEPFYGIPEEMPGSSSVRVGTRVTVQMAGRDYVSVVSAMDVRLSVAESRIRPVLGIETALAPVSLEELQLWRFVSEYYMCSIGEVYKAAYPALKQTGEISVLKSSERRMALMDRNMEALSARCGKLTGRIEAAICKAGRARSEETRKRYSADIDRLKQEMSEVEQRLEQIRQQRDCLQRGMKNVPIGITPSFALSTAQKKALDEIHRAFSSGKPALLHGVTGSGKTEIYMTLAIEALNAGKNVLYLVPEIAISSQIEERMEKVFGGILHVFHSKETVSRRAAIACSVRREQYLVLGTRSAIFLPHENLGLVIVDEEHDVSYKQSDPAPRYNGRDAALVLARIHGADAVLGSATPSLESLYNCSSEKMVMVELTERYYGAENADIEIIDTLAERRKKGMSGSFSFKLMDRIRSVLKDGGQVLILRTRRSYSPSVQCSSCGYIMKCPHCNVPMSWHRDRNMMICHHCGHSVRFEGKCPECGGELMPLGAGTQRIEEEAAELFPEAKIARLDSDVAVNAKEAVSVIKDFSAGKTDILIGTQMISKGFDFDGLDLVAVIQSDSLLGQQDFRADERAIQILEQFRGRCGRRGRRGHFVIQTAQPCHPVYAHFMKDAVDADGKALSDNMMAERKAFGYPPFRRIVEVRMRDSNEVRLEKLSHDLAGFVQAASIPVMVTGPYVPLVDKVNDLYQRCIRLSFSRDNMLFSIKRKIWDIMRAFEKDRSWAGHMILDVDPQ